jgi:hypothetical protein
MYDMLLSCEFYEKERNKLCFQGACWTDVEKLLGGCAGLIRNWKLQNKKEEAAGLEEVAQELERRSARVPRLRWSIVPT